MNDRPEIGIRRVDGSDRAIALPRYETAGAAGADLRANFSEGARDGILLSPGQRALVPTGLILDIPTGWEVQIRPRSGLALKHGISLVNAPGTIDSDYRGPVGVILINLGDEPHHVRHGERIAQMVVAPALQARFRETDAISETARGAGGFGSTGVG